MDRRTHTHTPFNGPFAGTTRVSRYQKGKTNLDFTEARDSEWQWLSWAICKSGPRSRQVITASKHWRHYTNVSLISFNLTPCFRTAIRWHTKQQSTFYLLTPPWPCVIPLKYLAPIIMEEAISRGKTYIRYWQSRTHLSNLLRSTPETCTDVGMGTYPPNPQVYRQVSMGKSFSLDPLPSVLYRCWLGGRKGIRPVKKRVVGYWRGYLSGARCRLLTVSCCSKIQIGFTFLVPAYPGCPGKEAVKWLLLLLLLLSISAIEGSQWFSDYSSMRDCKSYVWTTNRCWGSQLHLDWIWWDSSASSCILSQSRRFRRRLPLSSSGINWLQSCYGINWLWYSLATQ